MNSGFKSIGTNLEVTDISLKNWQFNEFICHIENGTLHAFSCQTNTEQALKSSWKDINSLIAADYIANFECDFNRWNSYLLFICNEKIDNSTRFEIENDKFAMRKIVFDDMQHIIKNNKIIQVLNNKILATQLTLSDINIPQLPALQLGSKTLDLLNSDKLYTGNIKQQKEQRKTWLETQLNTLRQLEINQHLQLEGKKNEN